MLQNNKLKIVVKNHYMTSNSRRQPSKLNFLCVFVFVELSVKELENGNKKLDEMTQVSKGFRIPKKGVSNNFFKKAS